MAQQHEVDFKIVGDDLQFVEVDLDPGESAVAEAGSMMYMTPDIEMEAIQGGRKRQVAFAALTGPGRVWLQSLPFSRMADRIYKAAKAARSPAASASCSTAIRNNHGGSDSRNPPHEP